MFADDSYRVITDDVLKLNTDVMNIL
ncbi:hypothetical protein PCC21_027050 [Pectobacterium carotovorum subsp. carotovorum PCC21]|nr:hypothetical protein PCC21_027050 [Pectobacterium carotovorum subsp. carotovorum PCC21]